MPKANETIACNYCQISLTGYTEYAKQDQRTPRSPTGKQQPQRQTGHKRQPVYEQPISELYVVLCISAYCVLKLCLKKKYHININCCGTSNNSELGWAITNRGFERLLSDLRLWLETSRNPRINGTAVSFFLP